MNGRRLVVGVTGGVAAFKTAALVSRLVQSGAQVRVVLTEAAEAFVGPATFAALTGQPVARRLFDEAQFPLGAHIELAEHADLLCVAPATANFLAKAAQGFADDLLSTLYLAFSGPVLVAPAMNHHMWSQASVQRNVQQLLSDGVQFVDPDEGWLSCRQEGKGRMADPETILAAIERILAKTS
jgi:phosphopantothenoylcysteine decarboxylase/phosphopantothenate--cysteine ligase